MKLIVGLGNPGNQYNFTRHNTGFLALDFYLKTHQAEWHATPRLGAIYHKTPAAVFIKPQDFYNDSGKAVRAYLNFYKLDLTDILIICDDFNLPFGTTRYRQNGSAGGNNGLKSIIAELGSQDFARLRLGTGNDPLRTQMGDTDFVLSKFTPTEKSALPAFLNSACTRIDDFIQQ